MTRTATLVIIAGCVIALISFGVRSSMGLFLAPMSADLGFGRETFALAMAFQNLLWGIVQPFAGALADKYGPARVLSAGGVFYAAGIWLMSSASSPSDLYVSGGLLVGMGIAFSSFTVVTAAFAKMVRPERRSLVMGLGTAAGSMGQVVMVPFAGYLLSSFGWAEALFWISIAAAMMIPLGFSFAGREAQMALSTQSFREALNEAFSHRGYVLLTIGFFVCGFQIAFMTVHFPPYLTDKGLDISVAATALMFVGLFNIIGSLTAGWVGGRYSKKSSLSLLYLLRSIVTVAFLLTPISEISVYAFAITMGLLWLSTVPLTYGVVGQIFGPTYMTMLAGITFFSHQVGSFMGVWLGGLMYDLYGSYDPVWWAGVALGLMAAIIHWPIDERPLARTLAQAA